MRQGQQNRRGRGRGRKSQNPLSRSFESSGPDVKIRGTASHIAEKYISLARDALSSGDIVMAENYLQHAEHYNRIVAAAQMQAQPPEHVNGAGGPVRIQRHQGEQPAHADQGDNSPSASSEDASSPSEAVPVENAPPEPAPTKPRRRRTRSANGAVDRDEDRESKNKNESASDGPDSETSEAPDGAVA